MCGNAVAFIQPSLKSFTIYDLADDAKELAGRLQSPDCHIQELCLLDDELDLDDPDVYEPLYSMITLLKNLTSLTLVGFFSDEVFKHLASSTSLRNLSFLLNTNVAKMMSESPAKKFPTLQKLKVVVKPEHKNSLEPFLSAISSPDLLDIHVELEAFGDRSSERLQLKKRDLQSTLSAMAHINSLKHILLAVTPSHSKVAAKIDITALQEIFGIKGIHSIQATGIKFDLSSSDTKNISSAWPHVHSLCDCSKPVPSSEGGVRPAVVNLLPPRKSYS